MAHKNDGSFLAQFLAQKGADAAGGQAHYGQAYAPHAYAAALPQPYAYGQQQQQQQQHLQQQQQQHLQGPLQGHAYGGEGQAHGGHGQALGGHGQAHGQVHGQAALGQQMRWRPKEGAREAAPPFASAPADAREAALIRATAQFAVSRGLDAQEFLRYVQLRDEGGGGAARFPFVAAGGKGAPFFQWLLYCVRYGHPETQRPPGDDPAKRMPDGLVRKLDDLLNNLSGTKEAIRAGKERIVDEHVYASPIFATMANRARDMRDPKRALYQVYLTNDVLVHCTKYRTEKSILDPVSEAILESIFPILRAAYHGAPPPQQETVLGVVRLWGERGTYSEDIVRQLLEGVQAEVEPSQPVRTAEADLMVDDDVPPWLLPHVGDKRNAGELDEGREPMRRRFD